MFKYRTNHGKSNNQNFKNFAYNINNFITNTTDKPSLTRFSDHLFLRCK